MVNSGLDQETVDTRARLILVSMAIAMPMIATALLVTSGFGLQVMELLKYMEKRRNHGRGWTVDIFTATIHQQIICILYNQRRLGQ